MAKTEYENVTVKVPANLLRLLEEKNYFGKAKDQWFLQAVNDGIGSELDKLARIDGKSFKEVRRLEEKYSLDLVCRTVVEKHAKN